MADLWSRLQATASAAAEHAARASGAALEQAQAVRALAAEQVGSAMDRISALEVSELAAAAADTAERLRDRAARAGEQAAARAGALAADAAETLGELAHSEQRRAELAERLRALLLSDEDGVDDVAGERDTDLGITPALLEFVATLATLHASPADAPPPPPLTRWQVAHSKAMLAKSPHLAQLRSTLCQTMSEAQFWAAYFELCSDRIVPAAEAPPSPSVVLAPPGEQAAPRRHDDRSDDHRGDVHTLVAAIDSPPPAAAAEAHAAESEGALEDFLQAVLTPGGAASDAEATEVGGDAALEAEFAALLRGESGSSISLESADDGEAK